MKYWAAWAAFVAFPIAFSCRNKIDLGGTDQGNASGEGGEGAANESGGTDSGSGNGGTRGGRGGSSNGGEAARETGGNAGDSGTGANPSGGATQAGNGGRAGFGGAGAGGAPEGAGVGGAGSGGCGGSGGADGCRLCPPFPPGELLETCILGSDGMPVTTSFDASVTVVSVETSSGTPNACQGTGVFLSGGTSTRLVVEASDQRRFTLVLRIPNLPSDFAEPSDSFELSVFATASSHLFDHANQTIRLSRGSDLLLFGAVATGTPIDGLDGTEIQVVDDGVMCDDSASVFDCIKQHRRTRVIVGASVALLQPHQTQQVGGYSITVDSATSYLGCVDGVPFTQVAGVATGSTVPFTVLDNLPECPLHGDVSVFPPIPPLACTPDQIPMPGATFPWKGCYYNGDGCLCMELGGINTCTCVHPDSTCASGVNTSPLGTCKLGEVPTGSTFLWMFCGCDSSNGFYCGG